MEELTGPEEAEAKVLADVRAFLAELHSLTSEAQSLDEGTERLRKIRAAAYENLNQIQHEHLILRGLRWLRNNGYSDMGLKWFWNPRQTGGATEPDLRATKETTILLSAEATTSENPKGVIDSRMRNTLEKLSQMPGRQFYFVRTQAMAQRARAKIEKKSLKIQVVLCESPTA